MLKDADLKAIGRLIKKRRVELGMSARQLGQNAGISDAHVIYIEKAQRRPTFEKLVNMLTALGIGIDEMMRAIGKSENIEPALLGGFNRIPVVTLVMAGRWKEVCDSFEPGDADEWIESDIPGRSVFALRVKGDSMEPEFIDGEIIIVNPHIEAVPNDYVVVKNSKGEATFKQLKKYGPRWVLHPLNPRYEDLEVKKGAFRIIGKVVKKEKRY